MKFVLFNVAIIAALFYLFNADRVDFRSLADKAYEAVDGVRETADAVVATARAPAPRPAVPAASSKPPAAPEPEIVQAAPKQEVARAKPAKPAKPLDPAVAKRRAEVLGIDAVDTNTVANAEGKILMTAERRRRELFALAEDMELLYVRRLNR